MVSVRDLLENITRICQQQFMGVEALLTDFQCDVTEFVIVVQFSQS